MGANAQTSVPAFTAGQVLTAAQVTQINTGIPVFASSTERDAAFGGTGEKTLAEGQMAYLEDTNATQYYDGSSWAAVAGGKILQVVSTTKDDTFSASLAAGAAATVTGLSASITPTSTGSKILVSVNINGSSSPDFAVLSFLTERDGSPIGVGATAGSRTSVSGSSMAFVADTRSVITASSEYLDSPASTSALTYTVDILNVSGITRTVYVNRSDDDTNSNAYSRAISTITLMEVSA